MKSNIKHTLSLFIYVLGLLGGTILFLYAFAKESPIYAILGLCAFIIVSNIYNKLNYGR